MEDEHEQESAEVPHDDTTDVDMDDGHEGLESTLADSEAASSEADPEASANDVVDSPEMETAGSQDSEAVMHDPGEHDYSDEEEAPLTPEPVTIPVHAPAPVSGGDGNATPQGERHRRHKFGHRR